MAATDTHATRSETTLKELPTLLAELDDDARIILITALEGEHYLSCCGTRVDLRAAGIAKIQSSAHLSSSACAQQWRDAHLVCVRKYRKNGTYATTAEVEAVLETENSKIIDRTTLFSALLSATSPKAIAKRTALVPRSSFTSVPGVVRRTASTINLLEAASKTSTASSTVNVRQAVKPRSSSAQAARPGAAVRSPILTRRRSSTLQRQDKSNVESATPPTVPPIALPTSRAESRNSQDGCPTLKPILPRRVVEVSSPALRAARRSSLIPLLTPVRAAIRSELASISPDTPETPSLAARVKSEDRSPHATLSPNTSFIQAQDMQTLLNVISNLEKQYTRSQADNSALKTEVDSLQAEVFKLKSENETKSAASTTNQARTQDLEMENILLERRVEVLSTENNQLTAQIADLKRDFVLQAKHHKQALHSAKKEKTAKEALVKTHLEDLESLKAAHAAELDALRTEMTEKEEQDEAAGVPQPTEDVVEQHDRASEGSLTPVKRVVKDNCPRASASTLRTPDVCISLPAPLSRTPIRAVRLGTPRSRSAKKAKHGLHFWRKMAKSRLFA